MYYKQWLIIYLHYYHPTIFQPLTLRIHRDKKIEDSRDV